MSNDLLSLKIGAEILGIAQMSLNRWCNQGKMPFVEETIGKKKVRRVERQVLLSVGAKLVAGIKEKGSEKSAEAKPVEIKGALRQINGVQEPDEGKEREIIVDSKRALSRYEAERVIKQEDAIRKQRENLIAGGQLVEKDVIKSALEGALDKHYSGLVVFWEELIDVWALKFNLPAGAAKEMLTEFRVGLRRHWGNIQREVEKCYQI